jgi:general secretion pathway protein F
MQFFRLLVPSTNGTPKLITIAASTAEEAHDQATLLGGYLVSGGKTTLRAKLKSLNKPKPQAVDELIFCTQLQSLLAAGLTLQESIAALQKNSSSMMNSNLLAHITENFQKGLPFSSALKRASESLQGISPLLVSMVQAAEQTSELPQALANYVSYAEQIGTLKQKIKTALLYPSFLMLAGGLVVLFLLFFVVPRFAGIYDSVRVDLPFAAKLLLFWGQWVKSHGLLIFIFTTVVMICSLVVMSQPNRREKIINLGLKVFKLRPLVESIIFARLYRTLGMLLAGGLALNQALNLLAVSGNSEISNKLHKVVALVSQGISLTEAFARQNLYVSVAKSLISAGEASGNLPIMLTEAAKFIEVDTFRKIDQGMRLLEPLLMTVLGLVIGGIVILMYMPIFELAGSLQ